MPDYDFMLWDMNSFDVDGVPYVKQAASARKWAFASDYIRLWAIYNYGGIYLDSDIKVLKSFDDLLSEKAFTAFESGGRIAAWRFGGEKSAPVFKELLEFIATVLRYHNEIISALDGAGYKDVFAIGMQDA